LTLNPGMRLGPFEILAPIGAGGMGEVYRARDTRLDRTVAVKVLPSELASDPDRRMRLEREARAVAALNHPHICALYDVGHQDGLSFLVMEYIDGEQLASRLARGPLRLGEAVGYARQIGEALDHAHRLGIVHRDLKPANVLLTPAGVKLVDFGLARLSSFTQVTEAGMVLGTLGYMSPEQLRGDPADHRADIWALGALLYEMLTGTPPFAAEHPEAVWHKILQGQPAPLRERLKAAPETLAQTIDKALAKRKEDRFDSMSSLLTHLDRSAAAIDDGAAHWFGPKPVSAVRARRGWPVLLATLGAVAITGGIIRIVVGTRASGPVPLFASPVQVSADIGVEDYPTWSPDGRMLAYESSSGGNWDIWITQLGGSVPVTRTGDYPGADRFPSWSPDGAWIAFWSAREGGGVYLMPALSGRPRKLPFTSQGRAVRPVWSVDGSQLASVAPLDESTAIEILTIATGETRRIRVNDEIWELAWSPDGRFFACIGAQSPLSDVSRLILVRTSDARVFEIVGRPSNTWSPSWSADSRTLYFVSNRGGTMDLWQQRITDAGAEGPAVSLTNGVDIRRAVLSADGEKLAYAKGRRVGNIWRLPIRADRPAGWVDAEQITWDEALANYMAISPDGERLAFSSDRSGNPDVWILRMEGKELDRLTSTARPEGSLDWSSDGSSVAYAAEEDGNRELFTMPIGGGRVTRITRAAGDDLWPVWSPDGRGIAFYSDRTGNMDVWTVDAQGGNLRQLTTAAGYEGRPAWSPDGQWIAYRYGGSEESGVAIMPATGGASRRLVGGRVGVCRWSAEGLRIFCVADFSSAAASAKFDAAGVMELWEVDVRTGAARRLSALTGRRGEMGSFGLAVHGQQLYFTWHEDKSDIWVMSRSAVR
jgi:eukaryotic-like serine/threonine-protein kinase